MFEKLMNGEPSKKVFETINLVEDFWDQFWQQAPKFFRTFIDPTLANGIFGLDEVDGVISASDYRHDRIQIIKNGTVVDHGSYGFNRDASALKAASELREGNSIRILNVNHISQNVRMLTQRFEDILVGSVFTNCYFTPASEAGFNPHFDDHDVFILQTYGVKKWRVYDSYEGAIELPLSGTRSDSKHTHIPGEYKTYVLNPGDLLYLPRGVMHDAFCEEEASIHLTLGVLRPSIYDVIARLAKDVALRDVDFRKYVPSEWLDADFDPRGITDKLSIFFSKLCEEKELKRVIHAMARDRAISLKGRDSGLIKAAIEPPSLSIHTALEIVTHRFLRKQDTDDGVRLTTEWDAVELDPTEAYLLKEMQSKAHFTLDEFTDKASEGALLEMAVQLVQLGILKVSE